MRTRALRLEQAAEAIDARELLGRRMLRAKVGEPERNEVEREPIAVLAEEAARAQRVEPV